MDIEQLQGLIQDTDDRMQNLSNQLLERYEADVRTKMIGRTFIEWRTAMIDSLHPYWVGLLLAHNFDDFNPLQDMAVLWDADHTQV